LRVAPLLEEQYDGFDGGTGGTLERSAGAVENCVQVVVRQGVSRESKADDVGFPLGLLDRVNGAYSVDRARVYVTGASNGGC
jgi:poly(3-hydroxybutyrate) depolymerase